MEKDKEKFEKLLSDARLYVEEAHQKIQEWQTKLSERQRHLNTIEIIKDEK